MNKDIQDYNEAQAGSNRAVCDLLLREILLGLPEAESKVWHGAPVWFIEENPVVGYFVRKNHVSLLFWSGQSFDEAGLQPEGSFKAAEARYTETSQVNAADLQWWLQKAQDIQWDYKNIVKRRGVLERLK